MLSAVRSPCRVAATKGVLNPRKFATVVESSGLKVAAVENGQPSASVTFLVKAGSRHENKAGLAHVLKNYAFKNTNDRSALRIARESELYGGVLSSSLGREHLALTAEFLKGDEEYFVDVLSSVLTSSRFTPHEFAESVIPSVQAESTEAAHDPALTALDVAHALAFRSGLGASLFAAPTGPALTPEDVKAFASSAFTKSSVSVLGTGISAEALEKLVSKRLGSLPSGASGSSAASKYYGGESRVVVNGHGPQTIFIGYGSAGPVTPELSVLAAHLSSPTSIPWSDAPTSPFPNLPKDATVQTVLLPYSDASLLGFLIQAPTASSVLEAGKAVAAGIKEAGAGIKPEGLKKAIAKAKFAAATALDTRAGLLEKVALQVLTGEKATVESLFAGIEKVSDKAASTALSKLTKSKPVFVAVGDVHALPYADQLGL